MRPPSIIRRYSNSRVRTRVLIGSIVSAFAVLALALIVAAGLFIHRFDAIEATQSERKAEQILRALAADLHQLAISTRDYAEWDGSYQFIMQRDPRFLETNFTANSLAGMEVDVVALFDPDGRPLYSAEHIPDQPRLAIPARPELLQLLQRLRPQVHELRKLEPIERIVTTSDGVLAFSIVEINRSNRGDPTGAVLAFARLLGDDEILRIRQTSRLHVELTPLSTGVPASVPAAVRDWITSPSREPVFAWNADANHTISYALLRDVQGQSVALLSSPGTREIGNLGRRTTWMLMGAIALLFAVCGVLLTVFTVRLKRSLETQVAAERRHRETLDHLGEHDSLTELPNRVYLRNRLPQLLDDAVAANRLLSLMYVDLDNFKNVNDSRNHAAGDQLLRVIAARLEAATGPADIVVRSGGDEFVVVAPLLENILAIRAYASRLLAAVREPIVLDDVTLATSASIGIAVHPHDGEDVGTLMKHADIALYRAKELGRDNFQLFDAGMNTLLSEHVTIEQALRRAIGTGQIYLEFQPLVDLQSGMLTSFEALARWRHPEMGVVSPGRFIPVAEKSGLIVPLGEQILRLAIEQLHEWQRAGVTLVPVAVNVSPLQFERTDFCARFHELTLQHELDPMWVSFEVTESAWLQNSNKHVVMIDTLRHAGSKVYIDDFGTGFSNLSYLKRLPIDAVKIDQAFVRNINVDASDAAIISGVVAMAKHLNIDTIAEGIETAEQLECLRLMGCRRGQGYYFSKPLPAAQCRALLEQIGEMRQFTETLKLRAFQASVESSPA
jgi:diguanylate cyclase (GGDEF)-like protein